MSKFSGGKSRGTIDLRKRKPGSHSRTLPFNWGSRPKKPVGGRNSALRTRRRRLKALWIFGMLLLVASLGYGISRASHSPRMSITNVAVAGTEKISPELVKTHVETELFDDAFSFLSRQNIFFYPRKELEMSITEYFPRIHAVNISRESLLAQAITVTVEERRTSGRWCNDISCYLLDSEGFLFAEEATSTPDTSVRYTFKGPLSEANSPLGQVFLPEHFSNVFSLVEQLKKGGFFPQTVSITEGKDFSIQLARGYSIHISLEDDLEKVVRNLELVLSSDALRGKESQLEYIDLRFGNRVYYKFK